MDHELPAHLPFGFCSVCLERMQKEASGYTAFKISDGSALLQAYCVHREVGATILLRAGKPARWALITPIDAVEWKQFVAQRAGYYEQVALEYLKEDSGEKKGLH